MIRPETSTYSYYDGYIKAKKLNNRTPHRISVHLIETRGLRAEEHQASVDPFIVVSVCGRREQTAIQYDTANALWDITYHFNDIYLSDDEFQRENIHIQVFNANTFRANNLIGQFSFSLSIVNEKLASNFDPAILDHQIYQTWVPLRKNAVNVKNRKTLHAEGLLLVSVKVLKPGEFDNYLEDSGKLMRKNEKEKNHQVGLKQSKLGMNSLYADEKLLMTEYYGYDLKIRIFHAEDLPIMDFVTETSDPFFVIKFGATTFRTKTKYKTCNPTWNEEISIPVYLPTRSDKIILQIWDWSMGNPDELVATKTLKFSELLINEFSDAMWVNFYGKPINNVGFFGWLGDATGNVDEEANSFLGRVFLNITIRKNENPKKIHRHIESTKMNYNFKRYTLLFDLYSGSEISGSEIMVELCFGQDKNTRQSDWCAPDNNGKITFSVGKNSKNSAYESYVEKNTLCQFSEIVMLMEEMNMMSHSYRKEQFPDVIVNVYRRSVDTKPYRVGFLRFSPFDIWCTDWVLKPEWHELQGICDIEGNVIDYPGFILFAAGFGLNPPLSRPDIISFPETVKYNLRAHIYQVRGLPVSSEGGLSNAFVTVTFEDQTAVLWKSVPGEEHLNIGAAVLPIQKQTHTVPLTLNPCFYQTLCVESVECVKIANHLFENKQNIGKGIARNIKINVWHSPSNNELNSPSKATNSQFYCGQGPSHKANARKLLGTAYLAPWRCTFENWLINWQKPKWLKLYPPKRQKGIHIGYVLLQVSVLKEKDIRTINVHPLVEEILRFPFPKFQRYQLRLAPTRICNIQRGITGSKIDLSDCSITLSVPQPPPHLEDKAPYYTRVKNVKAGTVTKEILPHPVYTQTLKCIKLQFVPKETPFLLKEVILDVMMPDDPLQAPALTVILYDKPYSDENISRKILASASIPLSSYLMSDSKISVMEKMEILSIPEFMTESDILDEVNVADITDKVNIGIENLDYAILDIAFLNIQNCLSLNSETYEAIRSVQRQHELETEKMSQYMQRWPAGKSKTTGFTSISNIVDKEWERTTGAFPHVWFYPFNLRVGQVSKSSRQIENRILAQLRMAIWCKSLKDKDIRDSFADWEDLVSKPMKTMIRPRHVKVRLYIKTCEELISSKKKKLNPFLKIMILGDKSIPEDKNRIYNLNDVEKETRYLDNTLEVYKLYQLDAEMPNISMLKIQVFDRSAYSSIIPHHLIGETIIDISDRWYNSIWKDLSKRKNISHESRNLYCPGCIGPQGRLILRVEIYDAKYENQHKILNIEKPPPRDFELRVVLWDCQGIMKKDNKNIFFTVQYEYSNSYKSGHIFPTKDIQESNVVYNVRYGDATFNYRFKFPVTVPSKMPRLKIKAWGRSVIFQNTLLCEAVLDLEIMFKDAYLQNKRQHRPRAFVPLYNTRHLAKSIGKVGIELSLVTRHDADENPVGYARAAPNRDPFLPSLDVFKERESVYWYMYCTPCVCILLILVIVLYLPQYF